MKVEIEKVFIKTRIIVAQVEQEGDSEIKKMDYANAILTAHDLNSIKRFCEWATVNNKGDFVFNSTMLFYLDGSQCLLDEKFDKFTNKYYECIKYTNSIQEQSAKGNGSVTKGKLRTFGEAFINLFKVSKKNL